MTTDTVVAIAIAVISAAFYSGGFVWLTRTHIKETKLKLAEVVDSVGSVLKGQKHQDRRISRIEGAMMVWTGRKPVPVYVPRRRRR